MKEGKLALFGGQKVRVCPMPSRRLFGSDELKMVTRVFEDSWNSGLDFGYQGKYEALYTDAFCELQGGGYADAVSSGTAALFLGLKVLECDGHLSAGADIVLSPVTDPGGVAAVIVAGMNPIIADAAVGGFNMDENTFERALTQRTRVAIVTHVGGHAVDMRPILKLAKARAIKIIEDCSQAHGTKLRGQRVGGFGDIGVFSTMYSKAHATGGCGGLVYTKKQRYYRLARSLADRGKPFHRPRFDPKNPCEFLFPALNLNLDEVSCAIGLSTLAKLERTIEKRQKIVEKLEVEIGHLHSVSIHKPRVDCSPFFFFLTLRVDTAKIRVSKLRFARAVAAEGIPVNPDYRFVVSEWSWWKKNSTENADTPNALVFRNSSFNILFNENFDEEAVRDIARALSKVESYFLK